MLHWDLFQHLVRVATHWRPGQARRCSIVVDDAAVPLGECRRQGRVRNLQSVRFRTCEMRSVRFRTCEMRVSSFAPAKCEMPKFALRSTKHL